MTMLASGADDLRVWDGKKSDDLIKQYTPNVSKVSSLSWNYNNSQVVSISPGGCSIDVTHLDSDMQTVSYPILDEAVCLSWSNNGKHIALGCTDHEVKIFDLKTQTTKKTYKGHKSPLTCVTYNYNDTAIASSSKNGEVVLHNAITDLTTRLITTIKLQAIQGLQYSYHHHSMIASVSDDASLVLWDTGARRSIHQFTRSHKAPATDLMFSPANDKLLLSCGLDKNIVLYDVLNKSIVRTLQVDTPLSTISMNSNGYQIATGTIKGQILLHDLRVGSEIQHRFTAHRSSVHCLAYESKIRPKKSKSTSSHRSSSIDSYDSKHVNEEDHPLPQHTPLTTLDQNAKNGAMLEKLTSPRLPNNHKREGVAPLNYSAEGNKSASISLGVDNSLFSPDVSAASRHSSAYRENQSVNSAESALADRLAGNSVFSPAEDQVQHHQPTQSLYSPNLHNQVRSQDVPQHPVSKSRSQASTHIKRELPAPPAAAAPPADPTSHQLSPIQHRLNNTVHFSTPKGASPTDGREVIGAGGDSTEPFIQQMKMELKQQLKSDIMGEVKELVETMKDDIKQAISDHHLEMIKQFYLMQVHVETQASHHSLNHNLLRENEELKAEIERLKRCY